MHVDPWAGYTPRRWQAEALPVALDAIRRRERGVVSAIMGAGKSRLQAEICASGRGRVLLTVPTVALVEQMAVTLDERCPGEVGRYYTHAKETGARITICCLPSVPALVNDPSWPGPPALWICDEAHKSECQTLIDARERMAPMSAIGFTATPFRAEDGQELSLWDREVYVYGVADAMRDGVVVPFRQVPWRGAPDTDIDAACLDMIRGVLTAGPGLANAKTIDDAEAFAAYLSGSGVAAEAIHSRTPRADQTAILGRLHSGALAVVVHVNMLSEGVDLPWLRWLCMRRPVQSRVRFCQEVGRVLRSAPGKTEALLLDPHDLLGRFSLSYEAILAGMGVEPSEPFDQEAREVDEEGKDRDLNRIPPPTLRAAWQRYVRALYLAAMAGGLIESRVKSTHWRSHPASDKQRERAAREVGPLSRDTTIPVAHRRRLDEIVRASGDLSKGEVSDVLSLCFLFRDARRERRDAWAALVSQVRAEDA